MTIIWPPPVIPNILQTGVRGAQGVESLPAVARALGVITGSIAQMSVTSSERSRIVDKPDPLLSRTNFVSSSVRDFLLHGNTACLIIDRDEASNPAAVRYIPAHRWGLPDDTGTTGYTLDGRPVSASDVIHVQRGVDPANTRRGMGVVEQHLRDFQRIDLQSEYEKESLSKAGVPSVAVIAPQKDLTQDEADRAASAWADKFDGPARKPAILPNGTIIQALAWNPTDQQLTESKKLALTDVANIFNMDGYWLGAPSSSHTYKSPGTMYTAFLRMTLNPVIAPFEETWSALADGWKFRRLDLLVDDFTTEVTTGVAGVTAGLFTVEEWRERVGM